MTARWLGTLPDGWRDGRLDQVATAWTSNVDKHSVDGQVPVRLCNYTDVYKNDVIVEGMDFMTATATAEQVERFRLARGDTVVTKDSETADDIGVPAFIDYEADDFVCGYHLAIVRPTASVDPRYLYWVMGSQPTLRQWAVLASGVTRVGIRSTDLTKVAIPVPPPVQQRAIAHYLDHETAQIDTLIAEQERLIEIQRERRNAVIDRGVFGLDISSEGGRELRLIGRHRAIEPLLSAVPLAWGIERFKSVLNRLDERNVDLNFPMMSLKSTGDVVARSSTGERQEPDESSLPRYLVAHVDDLVVNPMWLIGGAIGVSSVDGAVSPDYRVFRSTGVHHPRYLHHLLRSRPYRDQYVLYTRAQTTFDRRVQQPDLNNMPLPVPPLADQAAIAERIDQALSRIDAMISETEVLIALAKERRSALITAAVTGQIDLRGAAA